ncbi:WD and tetratricopeptide repeats protein 1 [Lamellibrachia satsuma]|nr:WD and tetratricopeptide repeats protein 1 [Lamellibrachia satsuma]
MAFTNISTNICKQVSHREIRDGLAVGFQRSLQVTPSMIRRLGLEKELEGHSGCVNCLEWNADGSLLVSGSDDVQVIIWNPFTYEAVSKIRTGHTGNIFSVKFLPNSNDATLVSGAADCKICVHDLTAHETTHVFSCHAGRVKRLATAPNLPFIFWSAAEDGTIMQFDLRCPEMVKSNNPHNVLINLNAHMGVQAEAKCLAINPVHTYQLAVGANDPFVRIYDRRMLDCKSIQFPSDMTSRLPWERPLLEPDALSGDDYRLPPGCTQYYVPGHLPQKQRDYRHKYRTLASTYLTYSPDGSELLVNLGGEQIYLFDTNQQHPQKMLDLSSLLVATNGITKEACTPSNGFNGTTAAAAAAAAAAASIAASSSDNIEDKRTSCLGCDRNKSTSRPLSKAVEALKQRANAVFVMQQYCQAILLYNKAISIAPDSAVLYGKRAAAYMKRKWDGDMYAALRDCGMAIKLDPSHLKAHFHLAKSLFELSWTAEALECLQHFKAKFPDYVTSHACEALEKDIRAALKKGKDAETKATTRDGRTSSPRSQDSISEQETTWRNAAADYKQRFCGHCNTTTDIKEANFFGSNGQYIVAGSDDGSFFMWEKLTTNIVRVLRGDDSIVNCLQPHPSFCMLATSGIDPVVRLWSPMPEDGRKNDREVDNSDDAATANQKRMNADPLEVMLMNMGYRITGLPDSDLEEGREGGGGPIQCRPS